jgi:hypothetical protein
MMQNIDSVTLVITQDATRITREMKLGGGAMAGPGGGQGGGRGAGRMMMGGGQSNSYNLDGSETVAENPRGRTTSKAKLTGGGKVFEITSTMSIDFQERHERSPHQSAGSCLKGALR